MATSEAELTQRLKEHSEVIKFAKEVIDIVISHDLQQETRKSADTVDKIKSKISKSKECVLKSIQAMEAKRSGLKAIIDEEYMKMNIGETTAFSVSEPNLSVARRNVEEVHSQIKRRAKDCKKLENEWKILEFHKKHRKLQRKVANIQFDLTSTEKNIKGYLKRSDDTLQTFEFDQAQDSISPCYVSNILWDSI